MSSPGQDKPVVLTLIFMIGVSAFAVDASFPAIPMTAEALGVELGLVQSTVSLYLLGYGLGQIPAGYLADTLGRRPVALWGTGLFVLAGVASAFAVSIDQLLVVRFIQGLLAACPAVVSRAVARDITEGSQTVRLMSVLTGSVGIAMLIAPVFGVGLMNLMGWRGGFAISAMMASIAWLLSYRYLEETGRKESQDHFLRGIWRSMKAFAESRQSLLGTALIGMAFAGFFAFLTMLSGILIQDYGYSENGFVVAYIIVAFGFILGGMLARKSAEKKVSGRLLNITAVGFFSCALAYGISFSLGLSAVGFIAIVFVFFTCIGALLPLATTLVLQPLARIAGMAAALLGTFQLLVGAGVGGLHANSGMAPLMSLGINVVAVGILVPLLLFLGRKQVAGQF